MKRQSARLCIAALLLSFIFEPYTVSMAALPAKEQLTIPENTEDTPEQPQTSKEPAASKEPLASEQPETSE